MSQIIANIKYCVKMLSKSLSLVAHNLGWLPAFIRPTPSWALTSIGMTHSTLTDFVGMVN
jgi:hypothetical protein